VQKAQRNSPMEGVIMRDSKQAVYNSIAKLDEVVDRITKQCFTDPIDRKQLHNGWWILKLRYKNLVQDIEARAGGKQLKL